MNKFALSITTYMLAIIVGGGVLACNTSQGTPTPVPPATPLSPATPRVAQYSNVQAMPAHGLYVTTKNLSNTSEGSSDDLDKLVVHSSLIVIGTVSANEPSVLRIQDQTPSDSSSSITNVQSVGNVYEVQVERYLKGGNGAESISVVQFIGLDYQDKGQTKQARSRDDDLLPVKSGRYLFFLTEQVDSEGYWMGTAQPYKFSLKNGKAKSESPLGDLGGAFPGRTEDELIGIVEEIVASNSN